MFTEWRRIVFSKWHFNGQQKAEYVSGDHEQG